MQIQHLKKPTTPKDLHSILILEAEEKQLEVTSRFYDALLPLLHNSKQPKSVPVGIQPAKVSYFS